MGEDPGDLYVSIAVTPHEVFKREGDNLVFTANLTWRDTIVGKSLAVPVFDSSEPFILETHAFGVVQNGMSYHVKQRGKPRSETERGDLVCRFVIGDVPSSEAPLSAAKRAAFAEVFDRV
jgi:molecular chaperone DnaJ